MTNSNSSDPQSNQLSLLIAETLVNIQAHWPLLPSGIWNSSGIRSVFRYLSDLNRRSRQAGLVNINELTQELEKRISEIHQKGIKPDAEEIGHLNQLYGKLQSAVAAVQESDIQQASGESGYDLIYLHQNNRSDEPITDAIINNGWRVLSLETIEDLLKSLIKEPVKVILIDTQYIQGMSEINPLLDQLRRQQKSHPELIFLTQECDIEIRLEVLRTGVTQCFSKPININDLMVSIKQTISPQPKPRQRVLVVEDDESQAKFASTLLNKGGLKTLTITDPLSVLEAVKQFQPDLILMDLYMPGANGIELTQVIRERTDLLNIPIVFLSGEDDMEKKLLALYTGADDFLTKPVRPQHLLATVKTRINRAQVVFSAGARGNIDHATGLHNRKVLLQQLDRHCQESRGEANVSGLFTITFADPETHGAAESGIDNLQDAAHAIRERLNKSDVLTRASDHSLGVMIKRNSIEQIEQTGQTLYDCLNSVTAGQQQQQNEFTFGIGLAFIDTELQDTDINLSRSETASLEAYRQHASGVINYQMQHQTTGAAEPSPDEFQRQQFLNALNTKLITFKEQRFNAAHEVAKEIIELIPLPAPATDIILLSNDSFVTAEQHGLSDEFDRYIVQYALKMLAQIAHDGKPTQIMIPISALAMNNQTLIEFIKSELRQLQIVGTGLNIEFNLPALAKNLKQARHFLGELSSLGINTLLGNFACNDTAYKVLAYLNADGARPHISMAKAGFEEVNEIAAQIHSLHAKIIMPRVEHFGQISLYWSEAADFVQSSYPDSH
jgi:PleD family two-component response regulator/EAL domain-containing protein (putative c-di-GMP-specific phosphodiesterase class I)